MGKYERFLLDGRQILSEQLGVLQDCADRRCCLQRRKDETGVFRHAAPHGIWRGALSDGDRKGYSASQPAHGVRVYQRHGSRGEMSSTERKRVRPVGKDITEGEISHANGKCQEK